MMRLNTRVVSVGPESGPIAGVWRVSEKHESSTHHPHHACLLDQAHPTARGYGLYLTHDPSGVGLDAPTVQLPASVKHVEDGDIINLSQDGRLTVLWKARARHNSLLLTERCDNYCIMCSQPPKTGPDEWLFERAERVVRLLPADTPQVGLTGGEPTLYPGELLKLLATLRDVLPATEVHLLSNGRRFADPSFSRSYATLGHSGLMVGIPLYAPESELHDYIVQAAGAFDET